MLTIFCESLIQGKIPDEWKLAIICPIFKKGSRTNPSNYRPISLTSIICKIIESIIRDELLKHLMVNKLLSKAQHGFIPRRSCLSNLLETLDFITSTLADGQNVDEIMLDFAKAFDLVPHKRLVHKLAAYGVADDLLEWFKDYLSNRKQMVMVGGENSTWTEVLSGVPQGSVLGPLLRCIYKRFT